MKYIDTDSYSRKLREQVIRLDTREVLIARIAGSYQERDLMVPANCRGYGRIRHFQYDKYPDWSPNPLPIYPAAKALGKKPNSILRAQAFQNSACNWRCWYCFVDDSRLSAVKRVSAFFTPGQLLDMYLSQDDPPEVIDLTGGQPDLTPEWVLWTMEELRKRGLEKKTYLWSDDNLSTSYFWDYLKEDQIKFMVHYQNYARVACFKGYSPESFSFNTNARSDLYDRQFEIYRRLLAEGFEMYAYVTLTSLPDPDLSRHMSDFVDRLQRISRNLPLRTVPLKITAYTPTKLRKRKEQSIALDFQHSAHSAWVQELKQRYSDTELSKPITDIPM